MTEQDLRAGETVFREGDDSTAVAYVLSGRVEILKEVNGGSVVLGEVGAGEYVGEMGVLESRPRLATVRAVTDVRLLMYQAAEFLERLSADPRVALGALQRLSERLRETNERLTECRGLSGIPSHSAPSESPPPTAPAPSTRPPELVRVPARPAAPTPNHRPTWRLTILGASERTREVLPTAGQKVPDVPYRVGRLPRSKERGAGLPVHLQFPDKSPFRLSRCHFALVADGDAYAVRDEGSHLGTTVNGVLIGQHAGRSLERLKPGENTVVAGGRDSPFAFQIVLEGE